MKLAVLAVLALFFAQEPAHELKYAGRTGPPVPVAGEVTLKLKLDGTEAITNMVRSSMEFLSFSEIRIKGEGVRRVTEGGIKIEYATARVEGTYDDEPFGFDFTRARPPKDLATAKLKQICWYLSMGGPDYRVSPRGEYASNDVNKDAWGEALDHVVNAIVRFSEKPQAAGGEWTSEWKGAYKQKDNEGIFAFKQKARLEKVEKSLATVAFETTGKLEIPEAKRDKNAEAQETKLEAKGTITLDLESGLLVSQECAGAVKSHYKGVDPNTGDTHELKVDFDVNSKFTRKD